MSDEIITALVGAAALLLGTFSGHFLSKSSQREELHTQYLASALSDMLLHYTHFLRELSDDNRELLLFDVERAKLFCSSALFRALEIFELSLTDDQIDTKQMSDRFSHVRDLARREFRQHKRRRKLRRIRQ